jgi:hypothetical protein
LNPGSPIISSQIIKQLKGMINNNGKVIFVYSTNGFDKNIHGWRWKNPTEFKEYFINSGFTIKNEFFTKIRILSLFPSVVIIKPIAYLLFVLKLHPMEYTLICEAP